jgi:hypothetical protein
MTATAKHWKPKLGDSGWEVEWCADVPRIEGTDDLDIDQADYRFADFKAKEEAMAFAKEIFPRDFFGSVRITPFRIEPLSDEWPYGATREYTADCDYYEGE